MYCTLVGILYVLHFRWYIPLRFVFLSLSVSCWFIVFVVRKATFRLVFLNRLVTFRTSELQYLKVSHFVLFCCSVYVSVTGNSCFIFLTVSFSSHCEQYILGIHCFELLCVSYCILAFSFIRQFFLQSVNNIFWESTVLSYCVCHIAFLLYPFNCQFFFTL